MATESSVIKKVFNYLNFGFDKYSGAHVNHAKKHSAKMPLYSPMISFNARERVCETAVGDLSAASDNTNANFGLI
jgi:hypothetical protein